MPEQIIKFISSPFGIVCILLMSILLIPLWKFLIWKMFSFDTRIEKILEQKKSSEVRLGRVTEVLAPLLDEFPVDVQKLGTSTVFIGQPVDYIHFDPENGISFIEIKSGNSKLSSSQKKLEELVKSGKVRWINMSVKGD